MTLPASAGFPRSGRSNHTWPLAPVVCSACSLPVPTSTVAVTSGSVCRSQPGVTGIGMLGHVGSVPNTASPKLPAGNPVPSNWKLELPIDGALFVNSAGVRPRDDAQPNPTGVTFAASSRLQKPRHFGAAAVGCSDQAPAAYSAVGVGVPPGSYGSRLPPDSLQTSQ